MSDANYELSYEGAKEMLIVNDVDSKDFLTGLFKVMYDELPALKFKNKNLLNIKKRYTMTNERLEHIKRMESILNKAEPFFEESEKFLQRWEQLYSDIRELENYYYSTQWKEDVQTSNRNEIPEGIPHGVLSEDLIYNALGTQQCIAIAFLKHVTKIIAKE